MEARDEAIIVLTYLIKNIDHQHFKNQNVMLWIKLYFDFFICNIVIRFACHEFLINLVYNFIVFELWKFEISQKDLDF